MLFRGFKLAGVIVNEEIGTMTLSCLTVTRGNGNESGYGLTFALRNDRGIFVGGVG